MDYCCAVLRSSHFIDFFFNVTARTGLYTLSLHDALPISSATCGSRWARSTCSTTRAVASRSARKWGSTRRASGKKRGSHASGRTRSSWIRRRSSASTRCGRSWELKSEVGGGRGRLVEEGGGGSREGQKFGGESLLVRYANFVKLPHTVFALPFALLGLVVASRETALTWRTLGLVVLAFTCARFVALGFNRIADRELDARNPRTRARELPSGRLTLRQAWVAVVVAAVVFLATAWALNPLCFALAPLALVFISAYSYAKHSGFSAHAVARN